MTDDEIRAALTDTDVVALTAWAEARGDGSEGHSSVEERLAVMCVIRNRVKKGFGSYSSVCLAAKQFSCWNPGSDPNHLALMALAACMAAGKPLDDPLAEETVFLAQGVLWDVVLDRTGGATHYFAPAAMVPVGATPAWAANVPVAARIGRQQFYKLA